MVDHKIELAKKTDHLVLSEIARKSKAKWGYPEEWLDLWNDVLQISADHISRYPTYKLLVNGGIIGFCSLEIDQSSIEVLHLWVLPKHGRRGYGSDLLSFCLSHHLTDNIRIVKVESDPNAVPFYEKFGFKTLRQIDSTPKGRKLPYMEVNAGDLKKHL
jgi:ribosomal protein S18 acetylase RimI-like enzyme